MPEVTVDPATALDADAIARIYNQAVLHSTATFDTEPVTAESRVAWLEAHASPMHPVLVARDGGDVLGWASLSPWSDRCAYAASVEVSTYVDEAFVRRGLGMRLARAVLDAGAAAGVHAVLARICTENAASIAMSERLGFTEVGVLREVGFKFDRWLDVAILEKLLTRG